MHALVEIVAALGVGGLGVLGGGYALALRRLRRANRLVPGRPTSAPTSWLWGLNRAALLHRRLRAVCQMAAASADQAGDALRRRRRSAPTSPLGRVAQDLVDQALSLDARVVAAHRLGGSWRRRSLAGLAAEVDRLEASASRLQGLAFAWQDHIEASSRIAPPALADQMDAVEAALGELSAGA